MSGQRSVALVACGREIGACDIKNIKEVVGLFTGLSREELAHTIGEHLSLVTASGRHKVKGCLRLLEKLDDLGEIQLPASGAYLRHPGFRVPNGLEARGQ